MRQCVRSQFSIFAQNCNKHSRLSAYSERISIRSCSLHARALQLYVALYHLWHTNHAHRLWTTQTLVRTALISVTHIQSQINWSALIFSDQFSLNDLVDSTTTTTTTAKTYKCRIKCACVIMSVSQTIYYKLKIQIKWKNIGEKTESVVSQSITPSDCNFI